MADRFTRCTRPDTFSANMARIATLASLKKDEDLAGATEMFAGGGGQGGS